MNHLVLVDIHQLQVRNVQIAHGAQRQRNGFVAAARLGRAQLATDVSQRAEDPRPVETLPFAMLAVIHDSPSIS